MRVLRNGYAVIELMRLRALNDREGVVDADVPAQRLRRVEVARGLAEDEIGGAVGRPTIDDGEVRHMPRSRIKVWP